MSDVFVALLLGVLQGITEFLPISSSGHLVLAHALFPQFSQPGVLFDATLHIGTLIAVCLYFWRDLWQMGTSPFAPVDEEVAASRRLLWLVIIGTIPTVILGLLFRRQFEAMFTDLRGTGVWFVITGVLLFLTDRVTTKGRKLSAMGTLDALAIGFAQGLSIIPALSRSGSTIAAGVFLGLERGLLVRYSFLLSVPAVLGAFLLEIVAHRQAIAQDFDLFSYSVGTLAAAIVGYWSIAVLLHMTRSRRLSIFGVYCCIVGVFTFFVAS